MKIFEMKRDRVYGIGFIDPNTVYESVLNKHPQDTENNLLMFLMNLNTRPEILFPYNFRLVLLSCATNSIFAYSMLSVVDELCMPAYINVCAGSTGSC